MGWRDWEDYPKSTPRKVKDGLKAKSQRGAIGETWWSKRFIQVLESFNIGARLSRGKSYARQGQVMNLDLEPGLVSAKVQGSSRTPYKVKIQIPLLSNKDWEHAEQAMSEQAVFMAKLLNGEMPHEIEAAFTACRLSLFPQSAKDLQTDCSCPDWSNPCKHIAAVYYLLAEKFDADPFLIFTWRGRTKDTLIEHLRALRGNLPDSEEPASVQDAFPAGESIPLSGCLENFWNAGSDLSTLQIQPKAAVIPDALLRQLEPLPLQIGGKNAVELLVPVYRKMTLKAQQKAEGEE